MKPTKQEKDIEDDIAQQDAVDLTEREQVEREVINVYFAVRNLRREQKEWFTIKDRNNLLNAEFSLNQIELKEEKNGK